MTGPERHVLNAIAALTLESMDDQNSPVWARTRGAAVSEVAALSKYPDLEYRRHVESLARKGYATTWTADQHRWGQHKRVKLTASGWMEALA